MVFNPFLAQRLGELYRKDRLREAGLFRLACAVRDAAPADKPSSHDLVGLLQYLVRTVIFVNRAGPEVEETR